MNSRLDLQPVVSSGRVLVLATDPGLVGNVRAALEPAQFEVRQASDAAAAAALLNEWRPDAAVVDLDTIGPPLLQWAAPRLPALALTRRTELAIKLSAFERGVDDVLVVPFAAEELVARATALVRRTRRPSTRAVLRTGDLEIDLLRRKTTLAGIEVGLSPIEQSLLYLLATNAGRVLSRDAILNALWGPDYTSDSNVVDRHIRNLRKKLDDDFRDPRFIATVARQGYRFIVSSVFEEAPHQSGRSGSDPPPPLRLASRSIGEPLRIHADRYRAAQTAFRRRHRLRQRRSRHGSVLTKCGGEASVGVR